MSRDAGWAAFAALAPRAAAFGTTMLLARQLAPEAMGHVALVGAALAGLAAARDLGLPAALVAGAGGWEDRAGTAAPLALGAALALWGATALAAFPLAAAFDAPGLAGPIAAAGAVGVAAALGVVPAAALDRRLARRPRAAAEGVGALAYAGAALAAAASGTLAAGWIPVAGAAAQALACGAVLLAAAGALPRWRLDRDAAAALMRFGAPVAAAQLAVFAFCYVDNLAIELALGPAALGAYALAFTLANLPAVALGAVASRWLFPRYARASAAELPALFLAGLGAVAGLALPAAAGVALYAGPLVALAYGPGWEAAVAPTCALAGYGAARVLGGLASDALLALGAPEVVRRGLLAQLTAGLPAIGLGLIVGEAAAVAAALAALMVASAAWYLRDVAGRLGLGAADLAGALARPALAAAAVTAPTLACAGAPWWLQAIGSAALALAVAFGRAPARPHPQEAWP